MGEKLSFFEKISKLNFKDLLSWSEIKTAAKFSKYLLALSIGLSGVIAYAQDSHSDGTSSSDRAAELIKSYKNIVEKYYITDTEVVNPKSGMDTSLHLIKDVDGTPKEILALSNVTNTDFDVYKNDLGNLAVAISCQSSAQDDRTPGGRIALPSHPEKPFSECLSGRRLTVVLFDSHGKAKAITFDTPDLTMPRFDQKTGDLYFKGSPYVFSEDTPNPTDGEIIYRLKYKNLLKLSSSTPVGKTAIIKNSNGFDFDRPSYNFVEGALVAADPNVVDAENGKLVIEDDGYSRYRDYLPYVLDYAVDNGNITINPYQIDGGYRSRNLNGPSMDAAELLTNNDPDFDYGSLPEGRYLSTPAGRNSVDAVYKMVVFVEKSPNEKKAELLHPPEVFHMSQTRFYLQERENGSAFPDVALVRDTNGAKEDLAIMPKAKDVTFAIFKDDPMATANFPKATTIAINCRNAESVTQPMSLLFGEKAVSVNCSEVPKTMLIRIEEDGTRKAIILNTPTGNISFTEGGNLIFSSQNLSLDAATGKTVVDRNHTVIYQMTKEYIDSQFESLPNKGSRINPITQFQAEELATLTRPAALRNDNIYDDFVTGLKVSPRGEISFATLDKMGPGDYREQLVWDQIDSNTSYDESFPGQYLEIQPVDPLPHTNSSGLVVLELEIPGN